MSVSTIFTVHCNDCGVWASEQSDENKREALELAKAQGFVRVKVPNESMWDFCPKCYEEYKNGDVY